MDIIKQGGGIGTITIKGSIDCSTNPNYPAANAGDIYVVSVAGKIGGASGPSVDVGDWIVCNVDGTPSGTHAAVGANWAIIPLSDQTEYTNANPTLVTLGGIAAGSTFASVPYNTMWTNLLYPYLAPTVSLAVSPLAGLREFGDAATISIDLTPTTTKKSNPITTLTLTRSGTGVIYTYAAPISGGGVEATYTDAIPVTTNTTYTATVGDGTSTGTATQTFSFCYPIYYGVDVDGLTGAQIRTNLTNLIALPASVTLSFTPNANRVYYAYPATSPDLTSILDENGFEVISSYTHSVVAITGLDGTSQNYKVYKSNTDIGLGVATTFTLIY